MSYSNKMNLKLIQKEEIQVKELIDTFRDMAKEGTLLAGGCVSQKDLLIQIEGVIVKVAMKNKDEILKDAPDMTE